MFISSNSGVTWTEAMRMPRSQRHAFLTVYQQQNPPPDEPSYQGYQGSDDD